MKTRKVLRVPNPEAAGDDPVRSRILEVAREQFLRLGFSPVTMDDIASAAGLGKATLYRYFPGKERLFREVILGQLVEVERGIDDRIRSRDRDFVEKLAGILSFMGLELAKLGGLITLDMQRNAPAVWKEFEAFRRQRIFAKLKQIFEEGRASGVFRDDVNQDFLIYLYAAIIQEVMTPATLVPFSLSFAEAFEIIITILLEGALTDKARSRYLTRSAGIIPRKNRSLR
jgi:TetR/AcrR family transcriptional regulator, cholesterol catabolism regulator